MSLDFLNSLFADVIQNFETLFGGPHRCLVRVFVVPVCLDTKNTKLPILIFVYVDLVAHSSHVERPIRKSLANDGVSTKVRDWTYAVNDCFGVVKVTSSDEYHVRTNGYIFEDVPGCVDVLEDSFDGVTSRLSSFTLSG